ncbi:MAG TPA: hypothetical protein EYP46_03315 [Hadesarchaea archaeon]|nr:hypothetical protein [Hadesarchaea archaeon]
MSSEEHARAGYEAWVGGIDLLKDDGNLSGQRFKGKILPKNSLSMVQMRHLYFRPLLKFPPVGPHKQVF